MKKIEVNSQEFWDRMFDIERFNNSDRADPERYKMIIKHIKKNDKVLDFGCGPGTFLTWLKKKKPNTKCTGIDISQRALLYAQHDCRENNFYHNNEIVGGTYDVILMQHVIEHVPNPEHYVKAAIENLNKNGRLILVLPMYDRPYEPHLTQWSLDSLREFMLPYKNLSWIITHRPYTGRYFDDGENLEEAIVFCEVIK